MHLIARHWEAIDGIQFHPCNPGHLGRLSRDFGFALAACRLAKTIDADLIQSHERLSCCDIYRAGDGVHRQWLRQRGRVLSSWQRGMMHANPYHLYIQWAERRMFQSRRLKAVICNSQMVKDEILRNFRIDADKIHVIRNGIDTQSFHPDLRRQSLALRRNWQLPEHVPVFVFVGSGFERKGLQATLDAFSKTDTSAYLLVVGHDKHQPRYRDFAKQLGIERRVIFTGSQADVKPFYAMANAFILPTLYDPFPNAALEAMACGLPVITSHQSGVAEMISEGEQGFVCDALDRQGLTKALNRLCDPQLAETLGKNARIQAENLDWTLISNQLTTLYTTLIK